MEPKFDPNAITVPVLELAPVMGSEEVAEFHLRRFKIEVLSDWAGRRCIRVADARKVVLEQRAAVEAHSDRWAAFHNWVAAKREAKAREREAQALAAAQERAKIKDERRRRIEEELAIQRQRDAEAAEAERATNGLTFADFEKTL